MDPWHDLEARYSERVPVLAEREQDALLRRALEERYLAWTRAAAFGVVHDLSRLLEERARTTPWLSSVPLRVSEAAPTPLHVERIASMSASAWGVCVHAHAQCSSSAPPTLHFLRQWGGHRSPRMACVPGCWLKRREDGGTTLHRFDAQATPVQLDELAATVLALLLGRAGRG